MRISIYFCWQWSGKVAIGWPYSPNGIQHLTPNKCLKYLGRKSVGLRRLNPTLRISIHHCWLWSGKVAIGWPYSLGNFSCFLSRNFSHSVNPDKNLVFSRQEFVVFRFFVQDIRERRQICRVMTMPVYMSDQQLNMTFSFVYSSITIHTSHTHTHKHKQVHTMTHNLI